MDIWSQRVLRHWMEDKWGGVPAALWDLATIISIGIVGAGLGFLWATQGGLNLSDFFLIAGWACAGLLAGWVYVLIRRPS